MGSKKTSSLDSSTVKILNSISFSCIEYLGIHNSKYLREVIEEWLFKITGHNNLRFDQLNRNLWIVATDTETNTFKLWSKDDTPTDLVADAVTASCCIPIYYSPFDNKYIDGGLVSNRPDFVFRNLPENYNILSFRTKAEDTKSTKLFSYLNSIVNSILEGADNLQHRSIRNVETITIDVGRFNPLDFSGITKKNIDYLVSKGKEAMKSFFDNKVLAFDQTADWDSDKTTDFLESMEQVHSIVALWSMNDFKEVWVSDPSLDWVWPLFPTVLKWCEKNIKIRVFCSKKDIITQKEAAIRRQLKYIGIEVEESNPSIMQRGFFFKDDNNWKAVCFTDSNGKFTGKRYSSPVDHDIINAEILRINQQTPPQQRPFSPILERLDPNSIIEKLKSNIEFYSNADISFERVKVSELCFMSSFVRSDKYVQIGTIYALYDKAHSYLDNMYTAQIAMLDTKKSIVTPIIIEEHQNRLIVIKGNVRLLYAYKATPKMNEIWAIVVRNVQTSLPSTNRITIDKVYLSETKRGPKERYGKDFNRDLFRKVDQAVRPDDEYLL